MLQGSMLVLKISIHTPARGVTVADIGDRRYKRYFDPHPREGGDLPFQG